MTRSELFVALDSEDADARRQAVIDLGGAEPEDVPSLLLTALGDSSWRVREEAVRVGAQLVDRLNLYDRLIGAICQGENVGLRNAAIALVGTVGGAAQAALERALREVDHDAKKFVIEAIASAGGPSASPVLAAELGSDDPNITAAVIEALAVSGGPAAENALLALLEQDAAFQRMAALDALNRLDARVPWKTLSHLLGDRLVWRVAISALGRCADQAALAPLLDALEDSSARVVSDAVRALDRLCDEVPDVVPEVARYAAEANSKLRARLASLSEHSELMVRQGAVLLLCLARDPHGLDGLLSLMREEVLPRAQMDAAHRWGAEAISLLLDRQARVAATERGLAIQLAGELAEQHLERGTIPRSSPVFSRLIAELRRALFGHDAELRLAAASAITSFAEPGDAVPLVEAALGDDWDLSDACAPALMRLAEREPGAVREALHHADLGRCSQDYVAELVARLDGPKAKSRLHNVLLTGEAPARGAAIAGLSLLGGDEVLELVTSAAADDSLLVRLRALEVLGDMRDDAGRPPGLAALLQALDSQAPAVRAAAARALGATGSIDAIEALSGLLDDQDGAIQVEALGALSRLDAPEVEGLLERGLEHPDAEVVKHSLELLHGRAPTRARRHVLSALRHERWDVRQLAARLLSAYRDEQAHVQLSEALLVEQDDMVRADLEAALRVAGRNR